MQPKQKKQKSDNSAPGDSPSSSLAVQPLVSQLIEQASTGAVKPKRKPKLPKPKPLPEKIEEVKTPVKATVEMPKVEKKPEPKPKAPPKAKLLPTDVGWQPSLNGWQMGILLNPDRVVLGDGPRILGYDCYATNLEGVDPAYAETKAGAIEKITVNIRKKIIECAKRTPPEKPSFTSIVGVRRPGAEAMMILVKLEGA